ncbi:MAG: hypothetical protein U9O94_00460 [Nanoarchaeota archaeon]|nr:hypothetical protein [Nanoarchaeota archaeon]
MKKNLPLFDALKPFMKSFIVKKIGSALSITIAGPIGYVVGMVVGLLLDYLLRPVWAKLRILGLFAYDVSRVKIIVKKIRKAKTVEERKDSFNDLQ